MTGPKRRMEIAASKNPNRKRKEHAEGNAENKRELKKKRGGEGR